MNNTKRFRDRVCTPFLTQQLKRPQPQVRQAVLQEDRQAVPQTCSSSTGRQTGCTLPLLHMVAPIHLRQSCLGSPPGSPPAPRSAFWVLASKAALEHSDCLYGSCLNKVPRASSLKRRQIFLCTHQVRSVWTSDRHWARWLSRSIWENLQKQNGRRKKWYEWTVSQQPKSLRSFSAKKNIPTQKETTSSTWDRSAELLLVLVHTHLSAPPAAEKRCCLMKTKMLLCGREGKQS